MKIRDEIWILADNRPGTFSQSIGLAEEIGIAYKIITLNYSIFSLLPNFLLSDSLIRIPSELREKITQMGYLPKIIISAGRRSAPIALNLKAQSQNRTKVIQIMNPNLDFAKFDFVILPQHDGITAEKFPNLITTVGALTRVDEKRLHEESQKFPQLQKITQTKIAVMVGGSSKKTHFSDEDAKILAQTAAKIAKNMNATLLILNSRRTGSEITKTISENLDCDFQLFDWEKLNGSNPYLAIVANADFFIVTGDSVSMISECASTGKPIYIFDQNKISGDKHRKFHQNLFAKNFAKKFSEDLKVLENFAPKKLQETKRVAQFIKDKIA